MELRTETSIEDEPADGGDGSAEQLGIHALVEFDLLARALGLWVLNACRIVYVIEEDGPLRRFAFAYGTLPEHAESGEERF